MSQTLSQIKALLRNHGLRPKKRLGQNFLHDGNQMARIVSAAQLEPGEPVLEVGPGTGNLSLRLLERGVKLLAVEADRDLEPILEQVLPLGCEDRVLLIMGDILAGKHQLSSAVSQAMGTTSFKLVANLPYNVASPLLANLVADYPMRLAVVTVQHEVAQRLCAGPGTKSYGPLGVLVQAMCEVEPISYLSPSCFIGSRSWCIGFSTSAVSRSGRSWAAPTSFRQESMHRPDRSSWKWNSSSRWPNASVDA